MLPRPHRSLGSQEISIGPILEQFSFGTDLLDAAQLPASFKARLKLPSDRRSALCG
jgi:hypothetical protein